MLLPACRTCPWCRALLLRKGFVAPLVLLLLGWVWTGCIELQEGERGIAPGQAVKISFIHTTDWHSRLVPYTYDPNRADTTMGIDIRYAPFGGVARMAHLIKKERAAATRVLHLDSGDTFQGAPIYNFFKGEVELRALSLIAPDAQALGNHDFDNGPKVLYDLVTRFTRFPVLAANYVFLDRDDPRGIYLGERVRPFVIRNVHGLKVAIIGMGNISSMTSVGEGGNSLGITPLEEIQTVQDWIDFLEPQVDLVVLLSHLGLDEDERVIRETRGLDLVFGGHHHVVLLPPKVVPDRTGRSVPLVHSGVFLKVLCVLDAVVQDGEVVSTQYRVLPVDSRVPDDRETLEMIEPYLWDMNRAADLRRVLAYTPKTIPRYGNATGDSALGDLVTEAMQRRRQVETDFAVTNSLGIRADIQPGPVTEELLFNVFPFENTVTKMMLSGREVVEMLDFVAQRSAARGCNSQAQVAGVRFKMHCLLDEPTGSWADEIMVGQRWDGQRWVGGEAIVGPRRCVMDKEGISPLSYEVAVNDYMAAGGSGFRMLKMNTSKVHTGIAIRTVVADHLRKLGRCGSYCGSAAGQDGSSCNLFDLCLKTGLATCPAAASCVAEPSCAARRKCAAGLANSCPALDACLADWEEECPIIRNCIRSLTEYYAETCRLPWRTCAKNADCLGAEEQCVGGICQRCERGECSSGLAPPTCLSDADCRPDEVCDPLHVGSQQADSDVMFCYRKDCWDEAQKLDPTRIPYYCRADIEPQCLMRNLRRANEECPNLPCIMAEEDGRIERYTRTLADLPADCAAPSEATEDQAIEEFDRCFEDGVCWQ